MSSWEDQVAPNGSVVTKFSNLNVNAPEFIPGEPYIYNPVEQVPSPKIVPIDEPLKPIEIEKTTKKVNEEITHVKCNEKKDTKSITIPDKDIINLVFIGHVDAGKSTIGGHLLFLTDMVDKRTLEKYEKEAKEKNRETWYLSWALDTNVEERDKGKTVECGRAYFETKNKRFILIDAPGHKAYVPNMISGAAVADIAILVISARRGEFETGFEKGGQTREHALLVKTAGVKHLVVLVNKMDDQTVMWNEARYTECKDKILPYLKKIGFNTKNDVYFMPCSGFTGAFLRDLANESVCSWYRGPSLLDYLDSLQNFTRNIDGPLRLPISDKYKDMGTYVSGKIESGSISRGQSLILLPNKLSVEVLQVCVGDISVEDAVAGEHCKLKLKNVEEEDVSTGFCLCSSENLCQVSNIFDAQLIILDHSSIICAGFLAILHIHTCVKEVRLRSIICRLDKKTGEKTEVRPRFIKKDDAAIVRLEVLGGTICLETFQTFSQLGRFTLRYEGKTIAVGKVVKVGKPIDTEA